MKNSMRMAVSNATEYLVEVGLEIGKKSHISKLGQAANPFSGNAKQEINKKSKIRCKASTFYSHYC